MLNAYLWTLVIASYITTVLFAYDKKLAQDGEIEKLKYGKASHAKRLCEYYALITTALGGALGAIIGLILFNHKANGSKKWHYLVAIIVASIVQALILLVLLEVISF